MRVLLAEDDIDMLDVTTYALRKYGYEVVGVTDGAATMSRWVKEQPDLVLLDVNLPGKSGMDLCREIRKQSSTPIIMLTAMGDESHIVEGFECGADDYVSKPVSYRELAMRMRAVLQRRIGEHVVESSTVARSGELSVDLSAHEVQKGGVPIRLTRLEVRILYFLLTNAGHIVSSQRLIELVWNYQGGDAFALLRLVGTPP
ncbi:MAG: response regulator transcription factor [Chloroflexi bacterium]|nr:response regulator transcription factor [Chloroflexota bacterium]